jgi:hypothetical protein
MTSKPELSAKPGDKFLDHQLQHGATISAQQQSFCFIRSEHGQFQTVAIGASGGGLAREGLFRANRSLMIEGPGLLGIDLERAAAIRANMIEATLRFARVHNLAAAALRTLD